MGWNTPVFTVTAVGQQQKRLLCVQYSNTSGSQTDRVLRTLNSPEHFEAAAADATELFLTVASSRMNRKKPG